MLLVLCGVLRRRRIASIEIVRWGTRDQPGFPGATSWCYRRRIPSHDAVNDLFNALDGTSLQRHASSQLGARSEMRRRRGCQQGDVVAIDGKTSRRTGDARKGRPALHMVSAWASRQQLVLGQEAVADKENEIIAIPRLLKMLELKGALVTIDAMVLPEGDERAGPYETRAPTTCCRSRATKRPSRSSCAVLHRAAGRGLRRCRGPSITRPWRSMSPGRLEVRRHWSTDDIWLGAGAPDPTGRARHTSTMRRRGQVS